MKIVFSPAAESDLVEIGLYIAADDIERARSFIDELEAACAILADHPFAGIARPELGEGLRSKPHRRYVIYYSVLDECVRIERFLHGARDPGATLQDN